MIWHGHFLDVYYRQTKLFMIFLQISKNKIKFATK